MLKLDDCSDTLKVIHIGIDFIFLFDNYCGNDIVREDGSNVMRMNSVYGESK